MIPPEELAELESLRLLELSAEVVGAHAMSLIDDHKVPLGLAEVGEQLLVSRELIHAGDKKRVLLKGGYAEHGFAELRGEDLEGEPELQIQLVLPLIDQPSGRDDEAALDVLAQDQLLDVEPGHDRLTGARVVGKQEAQRRARAAARRRPRAADGAAAEWPTSLPRASGPIGPRA